MASFRKRNKGRKKDLKKQTEQSQKNKDQKGVFLKYFKVPDGIEEWRPKEGEHIFDVVPFNVGGNHPKLKPDTKTYFLEVYVHQNIGGKKEPIVCPYHTYGDDCPICAYINANFIDDKDEWSKIAAKRRVMYLVWVHSDVELEKKGVMLWETSHFNAESKFLDAAKNPRTGGSIVFADEDEGQSLFFEIKGKGKNQEWSAHKCIPREGDSALPDKILDKSFSLDEIVTYKTEKDFDYIDEAFSGQRTRLEGLEPKDKEDEGDKTGNDVPFEGDKESLGKKGKKDKKKSKGKKGKGKKKK